MAHVINLGGTTRGNNEVYNCICTTIINFFRKLYYVGHLLEIIVPYLYLKNAQPGNIQKYYQFILNVYI